MPNIHMAFLRTLVQSERIALESDADLRKLKVSNRTQAVFKAQPCLIDGYTGAGVV